MNPTHTALSRILALVYTLQPEACRTTAETRVYAALERIASEIAVEMQKATPIVISSPSDFPTIRPVLSLN